MNLLKENNAFLICDWWCFVFNREVTVTVFSRLTVHLPHFEKDLIQALFPANVENDNLVFGSGGGHVLAKNVPSHHSPTIFAKLII